MIKVNLWQIYLNMVLMIFIVPINYLPKSPLYLLTILITTILYLFIHGTCNIYGTY